MERSSYDWNWPGLSTVLDPGRERGSQGGEEDWAEGQAGLPADSAAHIPSRGGSAEQHCRAAGWGRGGRGGRLPRPCRDGRPTAAYTSWTRTPSPLRSEAARALRRSRKRLQAAQRGERIRLWVPVWLFQLNVSISCPWTVSCWHGTVEHYLPKLSAPTGGKRAWKPLVPVRAKSNLSQ